MGKKVCAILIWQTHNSADVSIFPSTRLDSFFSFQKSINISFDTMFFHFLQFHPWFGFKINLLAVQLDRKSHSNVNRRLIQNQLITG